MSDASSSNSCPFSTLAHLLIAIGNGSGDTGQVAKALKALKDATMAWPKTGATKTRVAAQLSEILKDDPNKLSQALNILGQVCALQTTAWAVSDVTPHGPSALPAGAAVSEFTDAVAMLPGPQVTKAWVAAYLTADLEHSTLELLRAVQTLEEVYTFYMTRASNSQTA